ncbi:hypothetical protein [Carboxylicivirga sp. N1Y90]|uniref:hypothetical protein n=1 Tax=Carboxylicivirga fragile TaxID=3417571 RepID=UPI003D34E778|nr:hypothetical protein [Marinilabiliaceae bacterium N1Y90]
MSETLSFTAQSIDKLALQHKDDVHFTQIVKRRLIFLLKIKEVHSSVKDIEWTINYSPVNKGNNSIRITLNDPRNKFAFYYNIPLLQRFHLQLYLGNNTFNFFEAHPLLIEKGVMKDDEYEVKATINTLPHLLLSKNSTRYELNLLEEKLTDNSSIESSKINQSIESAFRQFNQALFNIINTKWLL